MKNQNIYQNRSQEILALFEKAGSATRVMCVPIDYAKKDHVAMFCDGNGDILRKPFPVPNTPEGLDFLESQVLGSCRSRGIEREHVFFGGEEVGSYADNFISGLRGRGWLVAGVNALDAKNQRANLRASTDELDLLGIASTLIHKRGNCRHPQNGLHLDLRNLVRHRRKLVRTKTEVGNRIHAAADRLFPGFLDEGKSGVPPFSKASLKLMEDRFCAERIRRRRKPALVETLRRANATNPEKACCKLLEYAARVLPPQKEHVDTWQISLAQHVKHYRRLEDGIGLMEEQMALSLSRTPGAFLVSVAGVGIVLASGVAAEIGDPFGQKPVENVVSYAGIVPNVEQSGGPDGKTLVKKVSRRCNRILKDYLVQCALQIGLQGPEELMADYRRRDSNGQHADFGIGRRFLRMAMCMMRTSQIYLPRRLRESGCPTEERAAYYSDVWPKFREKWRKAGALEEAFRKDRPLGQWRDVVQSLYKIKLEL
jgi:transposase